MQMGKKKLHETINVQLIFLCKRISDFMIFIKGHYSHMDIYVNHLITIVNTQRYSSNYSTL